MVGSCGRHNDIFGKTERILAKMTACFSMWTFRTLCSSWIGEDPDHGDTIEAWKDPSCVQAAKTKSCKSGMFIIISPRE